MNEPKLVPPSYRTIAVWTAIACILTVAVWIRVSIADGEALWRDEAQTVAIASQSFPFGILDALRHDGNSPLFYLVEHFFVSDRSAPHRELQDRALSVLLGLILIPVAFAAAWRLTDGSATASLAAAAAAAFSPVLVDLSTQVRPYAGVALATATMACAVVAVEKSGKGWLTYAIAAAVGFYLHALFAVTIAAFAVATLVSAARRRAWQNWLLTHAGIGLVVSPGLLFVHQQVQTLTIAGGRIPWGSSPTLDRLVAQAGVVLTGGEGGSQSIVVIGIVMVLAALAVVANRSARDLFLVAAVSLLLSFLLAFRSGGFETRYHTATLTLTLLVVSAGVAPIGRKFGYPGVALAAGWIVAAAAVNVSSSRQSPSFPRSSARQVAAMLSNATESDAIVIVPDTVAVAVNYYLPPRNPQIDLPAQRRVDMVDFRGWAERLSDRDSRTALNQMLRAQARREGRVWVVIWEPMLSPLPALGPRDAGRSALPAQWALGRSAVTSIDAYFRPVDAARVGPSAEPLSVMLCAPRVPETADRPTGHSEQ